MTEGGVPGDDERFRAADDGLDRPTLRPYPFVAGRGWLD